MHCSLDEVSCAFVHASGYPRCHAGHACSQPDTVVADHDSAGVEQAKAQPLTGNGLGNAKLTEPPTEPLTKDHDSDGDEPAAPAMSVAMIKAVQDAEGPKFYFPEQCRSNDDEEEEVVDDDLLGNSDGDPPAKSLKFFKRHGGKALFKKVLFKIIPIFVPTHVTPERARACTHARCSIFHAVTG